MKANHILTATLIAAAVSVQAQNTVYITTKANPNLVESVPMASEVSFEGNSMKVTGAINRTYNTSDITRASFTDRGEAFDTVLPPSIIDDYAFEVPWLNDLSAIKPVAEPFNPASDDADDFAQNHNFTTVVKVVYNGVSATVTGNPAAVKASVSGANVTITSNMAGVEFVISGKSDNGSFKLYGANKARITLNGLDLTANNRAAINIQNKKRNIIYLADGTTNRIADTGTYYTPEGEDEKGCFFSEGQLCFNGKGTLYVKGTCKHGIVSDDYIHVLDGAISVEVSELKATAIKAKDDYIQGGGYVQAASTGTAGKGVAATSGITIKGGELYAFCTGGVIMEEGKDDYTSASAIKCDLDITLASGTVGAMASGVGGKGINAGQHITIGAPNGTPEPEIFVKTTGQRIPEIKEENDFTGPAASPKGIKAKGNLLVDNGKIHVNTIGGDGAEGIEAKGTAHINGGTIICFCIDDVLNTGDGFFMNGGKIVGASLENDGLDVAYAYVNGGYCYLIGGSVDNTAYDTDGKTFYYNGGTLLGAGGILGGIPDYRSEKCSVTAYIKGVYNYIGLRDAEGKDIIAMSLPENYPLNKRGYNYCILIGSELIKPGKAYTLCGAQAIEGGTISDGLISGATLVDPTTLYQFTSDSVNTLLQ